MALDPFAGKAVNPFGGPSAPAPPSPRVIALAAEAEAEDAMRRAHRSWIYPLIGFGIILLFRLVLVPVLGRPPEIWGWVLLGVVLLFVLGGLWRLVSACWNLRKYRRWGFLWPISLGMIVNLPMLMFTAQAIGMVFRIDLAYQVTRFFRGW